MFSPFFKSDCGKNLKFGIWKGRPQLSIFGEKGSGEAPISLTIDNDTFALMKYVLRKGLEATGSFKQSIDIKVYNRDAKRFEVKYVFSVGKNDQGVYFIDLQMTGRPAIVFPLKLGNKFGLGGKDMNDEQKSKPAYSNFVDAFCDPNGYLFDPKFVPEDTRPSGGKTSSSSDYNKAKNDNSSHPSDDVF